MGEQNARIAYEIAVEEMKKVCDEKTDVLPVIRENAYPFRVDFIPNGQMSMFDSNTGEVGELQVICGIETTVRSTLRFEMDETILKKLVRMAKQAGMAYYHAFRERADEIEQEQ